MLKHQYLCLILVCVLHMTVSRPRHADMVEKIKEVILNEIERNPGTPIMPTNHMLKNLCVAKPFNHTITHKNCKQKTIKNRFCYGQCNSFYIPGTKPLATCLQCQPNLSVFEEVTLECFRKNRIKHKRIKVQMVISCKCGPCS